MSKYVEPKTGLLAALFAILYLPFAVIFDLTKALQIKSKSKPVWIACHSE